jgi:hypothetical protein
MIIKREKSNSKVTRYVLLAKKFAAVLTFSASGYFALRKSKYGSDGDKAISLFFMGWVTSRVAKCRFSRKQFCVIVPGVVLVIGSINPQPPSNAR